jgi:ubiquitin C-terminal hydrolase
MVWRSRFLVFILEGWHHKFDEWVPRYSKRLAPYRSIAKGGKEEGGVPHDPNEKNLDDLADPDDVAALFRGREWGSFYLVDLVIRFHQKGGFSEILRRLNIHDPNLPASTLRYYVEAIANISAILSKPFAATFVSRFANAVFETVLAFSDVEMRYLSKEIMDSLLENLERIMRRGMQRNDVGTAMEKFSLDSALRRFQSQVIERKINGLSFIASKATRIRRAYSNVNMDFGDKGYWISSPKVLTQWIQENHIIEDIFHSKDPHIELIKRSGEILKFLCSEKALTTGFLNDLWNSILKYLMLDSLSTEEQKTSDAMLKVLEEIAPLLDDDQSSLLLQLISKVPAHRLNSSLIDICREFSRTSALRSSDLAVKVVDVLWFMIQETPASDVSKKPSRAFLDVMEFARAKLDETLKTGFFHEKKVELLQECFQNYKESTSVLQALTTIPKIFESYPTRAYMHEELSRSDVSNWMQTEGRIEEIFFKDIVDFQSKCLKTLSSLKAAEVNGAYITSRSTYLDHVRTRLEFLKFLLVQEIVTLSRTHLDSLWKAFHDESLSVQAKEMFFRWLVDLLKSKKADPTYYVGQNVNFYSMDPISSRSKKLLSDEVLSHVFESKLSSPSMCQVTLAGFRCIEAFFLEVNVQRGAVEMAIESEQSTTPSFKVLFFSKLVGLELLWNVFLMSRSEENDVIEYSRNLIHHIYNRTHFQDEQTSLQIRKDFLEKCMKHVETCVPIKDYSGINRILKLLNMTLDVFERNSLFSSSPQFRPHGRQFKGKKLEITVSNNIPSSSAPRSLVVEIFDRESIGDFRLKISKRLGALPQCLRIFCAGHELKPDLHDHKSFIDLVTMFNTPEIPKNVIVTRTETQFRVQLLDPLTKQLTSEAKEVFSEIFYRFADPETKIMNIERLAKYIKSCGVSAFNYSEDRLKMLFRQFGVSKGDFLPPTYGAQDSSETPVSSDWYFDVNHFLDFYREACDSRLLNVYKDLQAHGFLEDLRSEKDALKEMETRVENPHSDPRMILCGFSRFLASEELDDKTSDNGEQYFELLFDVLHLEETDECSAASLVAESVWEILMRIPTNPKLKDSLLSLETTQGKALNWDQLFDSHSLRKLLYSLQVIEPMLSPQDATSEIKLSDALGEDSLTEDWRKKFTLSGGFAHLYKVFSKFSIKTGILSRVSRECLALLLTSVSIFVSGALSVSRPTFEEVARLVSMASQDLDIFLGEFVSAKPVKANDADDFSLSPDAPPIYGPDLPAGYIEGPTSPSIDAAIPPVGEQQEIMKLSRQMSSGLGDRILRHVNISELQETLWRLLNEASMQSVDTFERFDQVTVTMCTQLILCFFHFEPIKTFDHFKSLFAENHVALVRPMLSLNRFLRKQIGIVIYSISCLLFTDLSPNSFISSVLLQSMPSGVYSEDKNYEMFFAVLTLATRYQLSREKHGKDVQKIIDTLYERISVQALSHKSSEVLGSTKPDRILIGLLGLLAVLIESKHVQSEEDTASLIQILHQIIEEFLFSKEISSSKPKCKTVMSQNLAFNVVFQIIQKLKKKQLLSDLFSKLGSIIAQATKSDRWNYNPGNRIRSSLGFVGLKNQGCTCYMNSLLQQFFMMEDFRRGIMDAQAPMEAERSRQDNLLFQLQMMFGFLRTSQRQDYDTAPFCFSYKDESGKNPIDVRVQQDAQEFFNVFTDRIERLLKSTPYDRLLRNSFGGRLVNQMICQGGCGKIRETEEDFYTVSLQIAGKPTMKDSLDAYVSSETLNGVFCEHCNKKADTFRRVVLNDLPNTLIFHLKRFQLDFETFTNQKLNDRFEFPLEIDLHPYSKEGMAERDRVSKSESIDACDVDGKMEAQEVSVDIDSVLIEKIELPSLKPPEYFKYSLCGIVIHMGTAQAGHYFSYIKDKKSGGWVEFNDSVIKPFDINTLVRTHQL